MATWTVTELDYTTHGSGTDHSTASVSAGTDKLLILVANHRVIGTHGMSSVAGFGLTWTLLATDGHQDYGTSREMFLYYAMGTPSPNPDTVDVEYSASGESGQLLLYEIDETDNGIITGNNGTDAIGTTDGTFASITSGNDITLTLSSFAQSDNLLFVVGGSSDDVTNYVCESYTEIRDSAHTDNRTAIYHNASAGGEDTSVVITASGQGGAEDVAGIAMEIKHVAAAGGGVPVMRGLIGSMLVNGGLIR